MAHQRLNGFKVIPVIQKGRGEGMPHHMGMNPLLDQGLFCHGFDKAVNSLWGKIPFLIWSMLPQGIEEGMIGIGPIPGGLQVILDGDEGLSLQGDAPEFLALTDDVNDGLVPVGLEIPDFQAADFGLS